MKDFVFSRTGSKLGISPLMLAAMNGHVNAVKLLLDRGSDVNAQVCQFFLTVLAPCLSESCITIKINLNFYFHTSLWCLKRFYEGVFQAPQRIVKIKIQVNFSSGIGTGRINLIILSLKSNEKTLVHFCYFKSQFTKKYSHLVLI